MTQNLIKHTLENQVIPQRTIDGYVNATAMCKAHGKLIGDYLRIEPTKEFLAELERSMGTTIDVLVSKRMTGANELRGTWVHPYVAINLGQWLSPVFAVRVSSWVFEWMSRGHEFDLEYQKFLVKKDRIKEKGSDSGRYLASLRWHINQSLEKEEKEIMEKRQLSLFSDKTIH